MRVLVVWCPDWPVVAAAAEAGLSSRVPAAVVANNVVLACNAAARTEGVRRSSRRRDAQSRCPELAVLSANPDRDTRAFEPALAAVEALRPGVAPLRPGLLAVRAPGRFYGGEARAAAVITERLVDLEIHDVRIGIADDLFAAEQAARLAGTQSWKIVPEGGTAAFLGDLPIGVLDDAGLVGLLRRLGLDRLGDLAALPARDVLTRFGSYAARVHRLARGADPALPASRTPPPDLVCEVGFEPPLESTEAVCFSVRRTVEEFLGQLADRGLVCTGVRIEAEYDDGSPASSRCWVHSRWFAAADLVDRVHWQLQGGDLRAPVGLVRFRPETVEPDAAHAEGLWGGGTDERVERGVARVQAMLGYDAVLMPLRQGGRSPAERQALVPWGERAVGLRSAQLPWPGRLPAPAPTRVFVEPWATSVVGPAGQPVSINDRGVLSCPPTRFHTGSSPGWQPVEAWAGPWPVTEQWWEQPWDARGPGPAARFQIVAANGQAWLMRCEGDRWWTEAGYE